MDQVPSPVSSPAPIMNPHHNVLLPSDTSKILQNVLYGKGYSNYHYAMAGLYHPQLYDDPFRPRSGSLQSLGSTASSHRQDRSPSRESTSSHESLHLRASPISLPEENTSPVVCSTTTTMGGESKLFNILKGNVTSPFSNMFESSKSQFSPQPSFHIEQHSEPAVNEPISSPFRRHEPYPVVKRSVEASVEDDGPIDLSNRSKRSRNESLAPRRYTMPAEYSSKAALVRARIAARNAKLESTIVRPIEPCSSLIPSTSKYIDDNEEFSGNSILKNLLSGNSKKYSSIFFLSENSDRHSLSAPASPATHSYSEPASPLAGFDTPPLYMSDDQNARVTIAKKTLFPVRGRVTDWIQKTVDFAKNTSTFTSLSEDDQLTLLTNTWAKILLINMAENHFEFAVTPVSKDADPAEDNNSQEQPTMKSVESIQSFIKKCQNLGLDSREYGCVKSAVLFHIGVNGLSNRQLVEDTSIKSRKELQDYIKLKSPRDLLRYSNILLLLHTLSGINCTMVQNLFCRHIVNKETMAEYIKKLLQDESD